MNAARPAPDDAHQPHTSDARVALATSLRRLGHGLVAHQVDDGLLRSLAEQVDHMVPLVEAAPERSHAFLQPGNDIFAQPANEGPPSTPRNAFPDCVVSGRANPMGVAARLWREGDEAVLQTTLGAAFEGAPGRAHGGVVAAMIDQTMGMVLSILATPAFTGRLSVTYRGPTPLGVPLEARARLAERNGRKIIISAQLRSTEQLLAEAEGLFIAVDPEQFLVADG